MYFQNITTVSTYNSLTNSIAAFDDELYDWVSVWNNADLNIVQGAKGTVDLSISTVFTALPYPCNSPIVIENLFACFDASNSSLIIATLSNEGAAVNPRSIGAAGRDLASHVVRGSRKNMILLGYINGQHNICLHFKNAQYPSFTRPICWTEPDRVVSGLVITSLANHSIVAAYFAAGSGQTLVKAQMIHMRCGDGFVGPNEECDSVPNCNADCTCATGFGHDLNSNQCVFDLSAPMPPNPEIVPILDCFVHLNDTAVRGYFSYDNREAQAVQVVVGENNYFTQIGNDVGQTTVFATGRVYFPASAFAVTWSKQAIEWHLTKHVLTVDPASNTQICPASKYSKTCPYDSNQL